MIVDVTLVRFAVECNRCHTRLGGTRENVTDRWGDRHQSCFRAPVLGDIAARDNGWSVLEDGSHFCPDCTALIVAAAPKVTISQAKASTEFMGQPYAQRAATRQDVLHGRIERGLKKAKREYDRIARESGFLNPATRECWSEVESAFEALADLRTAAVTVAVAEPASTEFAGWGDTAHVGGAEVRLKHSRKPKGKKK